MSKIQLAVMDTGEANRRILNKDEYRADFRRVEAASLKRKTRLASAEGKRIFARCFYSFQASLYFVSALGRTKVPHEYVEQIEQAVRNKMDEGTKELNQAIDGAELLFKNHSIETVATYDTVPLEVEVGITSALGRRYFELIHKLDQLMPLLQPVPAQRTVFMLAVVAQIFLQSPVMQLVLCGAFIIFSSAAILFQINAIVRGGETNYVSATLSLYVSLYNIFTSLLQILGVLGGDRD